MDLALSMLLPNWDLQGEFDIMEYEDMYVLF